MAPQQARCPGQRGRDVGPAHVLPPRGAHPFTPGDAPWSPRPAQAAELPSQGSGGLCALSTSWPVLSGTRWRSALQKQRFGCGAGGPASRPPAPPGSQGPCFSSCRSGTRPARSASAPSRRATTAAPTGPSWLTTSPRGAPSCRFHTGLRTCASTRAPASCSCSLVRPAARRLSVSFVNEGWAGLGQAGAEPGPGRHLEGAVAAGRL